MFFFCILYFGWHHKYYRKMKEKKTRASIVFQIQLGFFFLLFCFVLFFFCYICCCCINLQIKPNTHLINAVIYLISVDELFENGNNGELVIATRQARLLFFFCSFVFLPRYFFNLFQLKVRSTEISNVRILSLL